MKNKKLRADTSQPLTEQINQNSLNLDQLEIPEIITIINNEDATVAQAVKAVLPEIGQAIERIVEVLSKGGRLFYIGAGTSGRLGILDASECPPTFGVEPDLVQAVIAGGDYAIKNSDEDAEDDMMTGRNDIASLITSNDIVVGITASGRTPYVIGAIEEANDRSAVTIGISCNLKTRLSEVSQFSIEILVGPEVITGSTRMKAGTAQKMVLNMISGTTMIKLGKVYGNLMVNVQGTNDKLKDRVIRIIIDATGVDQATAQKYCEKAKGSASVAILMIKYPKHELEVELCLQEVNWNFGKALETLEKRNRSEESS